MSCEMLGMVTFTTCKLIQVRMWKRRIAVVCVELGFLEGLELGNLNVYMGIITIQVLICFLHGLVKALVLVKHGSPGKLIPGVG